MKTKMTEIINHFDVPNEIEELSGVFRYRFFDPLEYVEEDSRFANDGVQEPRYVKLNWSSNSILLSGLGISEHDLKHRQNVFFPSDINSGFTCISGEEEEISNNQAMVISDSSSVGSKLEFLLESIASSEFTEAIEKNINDNQASAIPVLDPTTNLPLMATKKSISKTPSPDIMVRSANLSQIIGSSISSPLSGNSFDKLKEISESISEKQLAELDARKERRLLTSFGHSLKKLNSPAGEKLFSISRDTANSNKLENWTLCAYCVLKYREENGIKKYLYSRIVLEPSFRDPYVAYGKTYRYEVRPIFCKYVSPDGDSVVFLGSDESTHIDIECIEKKSPSPPKNVSFEYILGGNVEINWQRPESYVNDEDQVWDTNDIKGYQLFYRHSLQEPYQLYRYFTFNNTVPTSSRQHAAELISDDLVVSSEYEISQPYDINNFPSFYEYTRYIFEIRSNTDYYFALCSIDAHGNSSNYSNQYKIRRDNVTGEVDIQLASVEGAPKQYPNLLLSGELVEPAMKVSGYQYLDVYFAPDTRASIPNRNEAGTVLQLFELETQVEKKITITINET